MKTDIRKTISMPLVVLIKSLNSNSLTIKPTIFDKMAQALNKIMITLNILWSLRLRSTYLVDMSSSQTVTWANFNVFRKL